MRCLKKIDATAAYAGGRIYWADMSGVVYAARAATGEPVWQFPAGGPVLSSLLVDPEYVYVARYREGRIFMLRQADGKLVWTFGLDGTAYASPAIYRGRLYIGTEKGKLYAFGMQEVKGSATQIGQQN